MSANPTLSLMPAGVLSAPAISILRVPSGSSLHNRLTSASTSRGKAAASATLRSRSVRRSWSRSQASCNANGFVYVCTKNSAFFAETSGSVALTISRRSFGSRSGKAFSVSNRHTRSGDSRSISWWAQHVSWSNDPAHAVETTRMGAPAAARVRARSSTSF